MNKLLVKFYKTEEGPFLYIASAILFFGGLCYIIGWSHLWLPPILFFCGAGLLIISHRHNTPIKIFEKGIIFRPFIFKDKMKVSYADINNLVYYRNGNLPSTTVKESFKKVFNKEVKCMETRPHYHIIIKGEDYPFFNGKYYFYCGKLKCNKKREKKLNEVLEILKNKLADRWDKIYVLQ